MQLVEQWRASKEEEFFPLSTGPNNATDKIR
jgi:hypothetical protein